MRRHGSREVFQPDLGLRLRMAVALLLNAVLLLALLAAAGWLITIKDGYSVVLFFVGFALAGAFAARRGHGRARPAPNRVERAERMLERLCVVGDLPVPRLRCERGEEPLSWTTALPSHEPIIHVTQGLLEGLDERQLAGVLAHELAHIANRDAVLMTVLAGPGVFVLRGIRVAWDQPDSGLRAKAGLIMFGACFALPALLSGGLCRIVSRHRELAADRGAALLTGSPAAVASAIYELSRGLQALPQADLRLVAPRDMLHVVPARPARGVRRLWATHPPLETRLSELERLEARLQA